LLDETFLATADGSLQTSVLERAEHPFDRRFLDDPGRDVPALGELLEHVVERDVLQRTATT
jgi:hypothetical protein